MAKKKTAEKPAENAIETVDTEKEAVSCCHILASAVAFSRASPRPVPGLQQGHVLSNMRTWWSPIVYVVPNRGRGASKVHGLTAVMAYCPFCGKKQPGRPSDG